MKSKILFLDCEKDDFYRREREKIKGVDSQLLYSKIDFINKVIRFFGIYFFSPILYFSYGSWKKKLSEYDVFILPSRKSAKYAVKYIKKKTNKRVIVWYWNIVTKEEINPRYCKKYNVEAWTFDKNDAKKYNMNYNDAYYFKNINKTDEDKAYNKDVFYIGTEKEDRVNVLKQLKNEFDNQKITYDINVVRNPHYKGKDNIKYAKKMKYEEVLKKIESSKAILDITNNNQVGLTLRPLEALFFKKKLITNNNSIINYEFYNKNNIFVIGKDNIDGIKEFINNDYVEISQNIIDTYDFENWLKRLLNSKHTKEEI